MTVEACGIVSNGSLKDGMVNKCLIKRYLIAGRLKLSRLIINSSKQPAALADIPENISQVESRKISPKSFLTISILVIFLSFRIIQQKFYLVSVPKERS